MSERSARGSSKGTIRDGWEALQSRLSQTVESVTRSSRIDIVSGSVDEVDPPEDLDQYHDYYKSTGIIRANLNQFVSDVTKPGVRVESPDDTTADYFNGGDAAPSDAPRGGFLKNCAVRGGEKGQPFYPLLKETILQRWTRGTVLTELLKADPDAPDSRISGFYHIRPETVYPRVYANTNILLPPELDELATRRGLSADDITRTRRDEVAAYIQFDDQSILGRRIGGYDRNEVPFSQNDIAKQTLDPDIGGANGDEEGIFGTSIIEPIAEEVAEYKQIKRDRARAIKTKAYGIWGAQFNTEVTEIPGQNEVIVEEWPPDEQDDWIDSVGSLGPGDILGYDGSIDFEKFEGDVPKLGDTLQHLVDDILAPLPAPKYAVGFGQDLNQFTTQQQEERYHRLIEEERQYQSNSWTEVFRTVAERHPDLDPEGLVVLIEPEAEESPIFALSDEETERLKTYATALDTLAGPNAGPGSLVNDETLREQIAHLPAEAAPDEEQPLDESDPEVEAQFESMFGEGGSRRDTSEGTDTDADDSESDADALDAVPDSIAGLEALAEFRTGTAVEWDGKRGVVVETVSGDTELEFDGETITADSGTIYIVAHEDGTDAVPESELEDSTWYEDVDADPEDAKNAEANAAYDAVGEALFDEALDVGFDSWPDSWEESPKPARLIAIRAWLAMGATWTGCYSEIGSKRLCSAFKDEILGTTDWRSWD